MRKLYISNPGVFWFCNRLFLLNTWSKTSWKVIYKNIHVCPSFAGGYTIEMKNIQKWMKRNQFYAELLKMGLSWSTNASNNPCSKDCKTKTGQPRQLFFNALSWASHTPADPLTFLLPKKDHNNEHLCSKGQGELLSFLFYSNARPQGLLSQWCFSRRQISSCKLFVIELGKTMSMGTSLPSFVPSRNIFYFFSFSVAWLNRPPFRWRWNPRAADTGTPVKDTR